MKSRILIVLLFALSSCGSTEYEKAIADWLQTDENGTWTDLKFELIELLDEKDVTVSDSLLYLDSKAAQQVQMIERAENPRALVKPLFSDYTKAKDNLKWVHPTFRVMRQSCRAYSLRVKYRSSLNPYALRFITFILLLIPSTFPVET